VGKKYEKSWDFDEILMGFDVFCYMMRHCYIVGISWDMSGISWDINMFGI
jgi:hypothetical protein